MYSIQEAKNAGRPPWTQTQKVEAPLFLKLQSATKADAPFYKPTIFFFD